MPWYKGLLGVLLSIPLTAQAALQLLVPAYENPCCQQGPAMWQQLLEAAQDPNRQYEIGIILNPLSGPGTERDPNFLDAQNNGPLADLKAAGARVYGYVSTDYTDRSMALVQQEIAAYLTGHYAGFTDGVFLDEVSNDLADLGYYQTLRAYIDNTQPGSVAIGNPGTPYLNNPSGQQQYSPTDYLEAFNILVSFESVAQEYLNEYVHFAYLEQSTPEAIAHIIYSQPDWDDSLFDLAISRGAGVLYISDDTLPNPYDRLPHYWQQLVSRLQQGSVTPTAAIPVSDTAGLLIAAMLAWRLQRRLKPAAVH